jgi:hypothetical protein
VGAIESTEFPLNLNVNLERVARTEESKGGGEGDEPKESERDVSLSSPVMDYSTSVESKSTSNGQFVRSTTDKTSRSSGPPSLEESPSSTNLPSVETQSPSDPDDVTAATSLSILARIKNQDGESSKPNTTEQLLEPLSVVVGQPNHILRRKDEEVLEIPYSSMYPIMTHSSYYSASKAEEGEAKEKPTNINLLRKLWSSTRSTKLNLTHEHQSLLRIESDKSNSSSSIGESKAGRIVSGTTFTPTTSHADLFQISSTFSPLTSYPTSAPSSVPFSTKLTSLRIPSLKTDEVKSVEIAPSPIGIYKNSYTSKTSDTTLPSESTFTTTTSSSNIATILSLPTPELHSIKYQLGDGVRRTEGLLSSTPFPVSPSRTTPKSRRDGPSSRLLPKPSSSFGRSYPMLYPEWLSSGGVYPDESTNGTGEYYGEPEYENLIISNENNGAGESSRSISKSNNVPGEEEGPLGQGGGGGRRIQFRKRFNAGFLQRVALNETWENKLRLREQQVLRETERAAPAPETMSTEGPEAIITQNGLADVISRGRIDSVMYVYFGDKYNDYHKEEIAGRIIQVGTSTTIHCLILPPFLHIGLSSP